jgi:hypothetical protein
LVPHDLEALHGEGLELLLRALESGRGLFDNVGRASAPSDNCQAVLECCHSDLQQHLKATWTSLGQAAQQQVQRVSGNPEYRTTSCLVVLNKPGVSLPHQDSPGPESDGYRVVWHLSLQVQPGERKPSGLAVCRKRSGSSGGTVLQQSATHGVLAKKSILAHGSDLHHAAVVEDSLTVSCICDVYLPPSRSPTDVHAPPSRSLTTYEKWMQEGGQGGSAAPPLMRSLKELLRRFSWGSPGTFRLAGVLPRLRNLATASGCCCRVRGWCAFEPDCCAWHRLRSQLASCHALAGHNGGKKSGQIAGELFLCESTASACRDVACCLC